MTLGFIIQHKGEDCTLKNFAVKNASQNCLVKNLLSKLPYQIQKFGCLTAKEAYNMAILAMNMINLPCKQVKAYILFLSMIPFHI